MSRFLPLFLTLLMAMPAFTQDKVELLRQFTTPIHSVSIADTSDADLQGLATAIGNSRIVMLGEMDNGDGETFKAKARIVRYLHQKLGFTVLAFESDFYSTNALWDKYQNGDSALQSVWGVWTEVEEFHDMAQYISQYSKGTDPLAITGFDCQVFYQPGMVDFLRQSSSLLHAMGYNQTEARNYLNTLVKANDYDTSKRMPDTTISYLRNFTIRVMNDIRSNPALDSSGMWLQTFNSMMGNAANCWLNRRVPVGYNFFRIQMDGTIHDRQMADNLRWLANNKYKDRKIIVWGNNQHVSKNSDLLDVDLSNYRKTQNTTMGSELAKIFKDDVFTIGFSSFDGTSGSPFQRNLKPYEIRPLGKNDWYTNTMASSKMNYAFSDFRAISKTPVANSHFIMRGWGYQYEMEGQWFNVFDGMFFIRTQRHGEQRGDTDYIFEEAVSSKQ
ncbi:MAG TPA: erythromycin esterase family protein [Chitinophagaceae bacterium]|nr:erythromycin esterase family protein [Chitinophagaceae bacterium]